MGNLFGDPGRVTNRPVSDDPAPTSPSERIVSLDALRGVAVLGILVINVRAFSMPETVLLNPTVYGDFSGANYWAWLAGHVLAEGTFITVFSALFGAGIVLFTRSKRAKGQRAARLHYRRTLLLTAAGLAHAYLLWYGDVLVAYGICGLVLAFARDWSPRALAAAGTALLLVAPLFEVLGALAAESEAIAAWWEPGEAALRAEVAAYRGGWIEQLDHRVPAALGRQTTGFLASTFWRVGGTILWGMALYKWGVVTGERSDRPYRLLVAGGLIGAGIVLAGVWYIEASGWSAGAAPFWRQFNYAGSLLVAGGYVGAVTLYARRRPEGPLTRALAAVGRTAFTNYLLQTVVATTVFYGHGLGLFGSVSRIEEIGRASCRERV